MWVKPRMTAHFKLCLLAQGEESRPLSQGGEGGKLQELRHVTCSTLKTHGTCKMF